MTENKKLLIGFNTNASRVLAGEPEFTVPVNDGKGVDFILCHHDPCNKTIDDACAEAEKIAEIFTENGVDFIANFEQQNFNINCTSPDGFDWANGNGDGTHRIRFPDRYVKALGAKGNLLGIMYDEFEHVIIHRNASIYMDSKFRKSLPVFMNAPTKDVKQQSEMLTRQIKDYADTVKKQGAGIFVGEHVFPVLFHTFAKCGIVPNFKSQKESISNVQFACAAGAAMQYGTPLYNCVDCWYRLTNPGHSAKEMYNNLVFAYLAGVDRVYVESSTVFFDRNENGKKTYNEYGKMFSRFSEEYRGKDRDYNIQDYRPEIGIIRLDDTYWGQGRIKYLWRNMLFGNPKIKASKEAKDYVKAFNIITHGATGNGGLSWDRIELFALRPHRSFAPMNSAVVFDNEVRRDKLESLKLCFLCGYHISEETLADAQQLVKENGLTVVTTKRFAPGRITGKCTGAYNEIKDGKGTWIVVNDMKNRRLKSRLAPFLGEKDEITLRFKDKTVRLKINENGEEFTVI